MHQLIEDEEFDKTAAANALEQHIGYADFGHGHEHQDIENIQDSEETEALVQLVLILVPIVDHEDRGKRDYKHDQINELFPPPVSFI
ncbi:hypothetical protein PATA110616_15035 [Paenibacillus tarimensis]